MRTNRKEFGKVGDEEEHDGADSVHVAQHFSGGLGGRAKEIGTKHCCEIGFVHLR